MTADLVARLEDACRTPAGNELPDHAEPWGADVALLREAASALRSSGEAVAWLCENNGDTGATTLPSAVEYWRARGWKVTPLYLHPATQASAWRPIAEAPADFRDGTFIVTNRLGEVAPMVRGVIQNNVGSRDWTFGEPITEWQPLPPTSTKGG